MKAIIKVDCADIRKTTCDMMNEWELEDEEFDNCVRDLQFYESVEHGVEVESLEEFFELIAEAEKHCAELIICDGGKTIYLEA